MSRKMPWIFRASYVLILIAGFSVAMQAQEKAAIPSWWQTDKEPSFEAYRDSPDRNWVTPIGAVGHHRTLGVTFSGNIGDLPETQQGSYETSPGQPNPSFSWVSGRRGVFHDALGLAVGTPAHFWGTGPKLQQRLLEGDLPVVISEGSEGGLHIEQTVFATLPHGEMVSRRGDEPLLAYVRVRVKNLAGTEQEAVIWAWRSSPVPELGEIGGLTRKFEGVRLIGSKVIGDSGNCHLIFFPGPWNLTFDSSSDSNDLRYFGRLSTQLPPGASKDFWYIYPYWPILSKDMASAIGREDYEEMLSRVSSAWKGLYSQGMTISAPDEKIGRAFAIGLADTLLLSQKVPWGLLLFDSEIFSGPGRNALPVDFYGTIRLGGYNLMCEDSAQKAIVHSLLQTGHFDYVRQALESIFHAQSLAQPRGAFGQEGSLSAGNTTAVGERGCSCEWESGTGYSLWAAAEYYNYTHDARWIQEHQEGIYAGLNWIKNERRRWDFHPGYEGLVRGLRVCDSAQAGYHPYNDIMSYWGMKDMVGVLSRLGLGGKDWSDEVRDYEERIKTVYGKDEFRSYIAGTEGDYGLATGAALMSGLYSIDSPLGRKLADGEHDGWYGMYHGFFKIEEGDNEKFLEQYFNLIATHMSHDTHANGEWPSENTAGDTNQTINLQPHDHSNAGFHFMTRAMLAYEDDDSIHLLRGIPSWWLTQTDKNIEVRQVSTTSGPISFTASRRGDQIKVLIDLPTRAPDKTIRLYLPVPRGSRITRVEINGEPWKQFDPAKNLISFSHRSGRVEVLAFME